MLLSKTVKTTWNPTNKKHYESKGYIFTKFRNEFEVKVEDLPRGSSSVKVEVKCDCEDCKNPYLKPIKWQDYLRYVKEDGKYYCVKCMMKIVTYESIQKTLLKKNGKSFEDWCNENNRLDILDRWDYELNVDKTPSEIGFGANKKYWFKCPRGLHNSELKNINSFTNGQEGSIYCNQCDSFGQRLLDTFGENGIRDYWAKENIIDPWKISYGSNKKVLIKCQEKHHHGSYSVSCGDFTGRDVRCSYCNGTKVHPLDSLGQLLKDKELLHLWSEKNKKSPYKYRPKSGEEVWWKCPDEIHEDYEREVDNSNIRDFRCPECAREREESFLQEKVRLYLNELGFETFHEHKCSIHPINPKTNKVLRYDNEIVLDNRHLIIEVHGQSHYLIDLNIKSNAKRKNISPQEELNYVKWKDKFKKLYVIDNNYEYLEIPYWTENDESYKELIDNKIKEILNKLNKAI